MKISIYANLVHLHLCFADMLIDVHGFNQIVKYIKQEKHYRKGMQ